jgi:hypothetical protein
MGQQSGWGDYTEQVRFTDGDKECPSLRMNSPRPQLHGGLKLIKDGITFARHENIRVNDTTIRVVGHPSVAVKKSEINSTVPVTEVADGLDYAFDIIVKGGDAFDLLESDKLFPPTEIEMSEQEYADLLDGEVVPTNTDKINAWMREHRPGMYGHSIQYHGYTYIPMDAAKMTMYGRFEYFTDDYDAAMNRVAEVSGPKTTVEIVTNGLTDGRTLYGVRYVDSDAGRVIQRDGNLVK